MKQWPATWSLAGVSSALVLLGVLRGLPTFHSKAAAQSVAPAVTRPDQKGLVARVDSLEKSLDAALNRIQALEAKQRDLETELKATRAEADKAITQIKANRKEVYSDIGAIFAVAQIPLKFWPFDQSHMHDELARQAGYVMGIRNGHRSATDAGSYRIMPKSLQDKCDRIRAEK